MLTDWPLRVWLPPGAMWLVTVNELLVAVSVLFLLFGVLLIAMSLIIGYRKGISGEDYFADGKWLCTWGFAGLFFGVSAVAAWLTFLAIKGLFWAVGSYRALNASSE